VRPLVHAAILVLVACTATDASRSLPGRPDAGFRVHYDLALHPERAELRRGRSLVIVPGTAAGAKYTLGGWRTAIAPSAQRAGVIEGDSGSVLVPVDDDGETSIAVRCRVRTGTWLALYLDGEKVHGARVSPGEAGTHVFKTRLDRGEHVLTVRAPGGVEVEWILVGPVAETPGPDAPDPLPTIGAHPGGSRCFTIHAGWTLGHAFEVPAQARLRATLVGRRKGTTVIRAFRDGSPPVDLGSYGASPRGTRIDVDLGSLAGKVARIDLGASGSQVRVCEPRIVVPGVPAWRSHEHPRNVILFLVDTQRADRLRAYDPGSRVRSPGLDRFVRRAAVFENSHTQANWTKPSVATLLSSLLPWQHGAITRTAVLPGSIPLLQEHLQQQGYYTAGFVTNSFISRSFGFERGWDEWVHSKETGRSRGALVADDVLGWLDVRPAFQPFFLYVHTTDPHSPYVPPQEILDLYDAEPYDGVVSFARDPLLIDSIRRRGLVLEERDRTRLEALYEGEVTYHDEQFARILEGLAERGLDGETLVVFVADHGEELFDHGSVGHGQSLWEEVLHVPIVVRWPGVTEAPDRISEPAGLVDVAPTILDILGLPVPGSMKGHSLVPLMLGRPSTAPRTTVCSSRDSWRCLVAGRYKLLEHATSRHATSPMLFDLQADPGERTDLAPLMPLTLRTLRGLLGLAIHEAGPSPHAQDVSQAVIDPSTAMQLQALGYVTPEGR
jgi:arylsulfatase A-like enzyme